MTSIPSRVTHPETSAGRQFRSAISMALLFCIAAVVLFIALRSPLKDDIAWLLYVARRWLAGRELYIDVVEVNPPLIVWVSAIPLEIAGWLNVDPQFVAMPLFVAFVLGCAWWAACLLRPRGGIFADRVVNFAVTGSVLLVLPATDLGQREHLMVAAFLPYLVLFARTLDAREGPDRLAGMTGSATARSVALALGACALAGLGCALKPRYAAVFAVLELLALTRGLRPWRMMPIAAGTTLVAYAFMVTILCPAYVRRAVPMALALYEATDVPFMTLLSDSVMLLCGQAVAIGLLWFRRRSLSDYNLIFTLVIFAATCTVVCFVDGKDWYYHRLPATVATVLALVVWIATEVRQRRWRLHWPVVVASAAVAMFCGSALQRLEPEAFEAIEQRHTAVDRLEQIIRAEHAHSYIAFSEWIALGFPVVNETGVGWASRFDSMWALKGEVWRARFDPAAEKEWPIARWVAHDFIAGCPDIAVVDTRETTKYISVLSAADPAFARVWSRYRQIASFDGLVVYRRGRAGCFDVWVAAESKAMIDAR